MMSLNKMLGIGCGDGGCVFGSPGGMVTNGGCRCFKDLKDSKLRSQYLSGIHLLRQIADLPEVELALREIKSRIIQSWYQDELDKYNPG